MEFVVEVQSDDLAHLGPAVELCFAHEVFSHDKATHYVAKKNEMLLLWRSVEGSSPLPFEMNAEATAVFLKAWLSNRQLGDWPNEPDIDGSVERGWKLTNAFSPVGVVRLSLMWIAYHK